MAVDDGQRRAELVRRHRDEIPLQQGQALFLRQPLLEHRRLAGEHALAAHQLDRIVAKDDGGLRHLADLIASFGLADIDIGVVSGQPAHAVGEMQKRSRDRAADMDKGGDDHHAGDHHGEKDEPERLPIGDAETVAGDLRVGDRLVGQLAERVACRVVGLP